MDSNQPTQSSESVFTYGAPNLKFGPGAADEIGFDLSTTGARRVLVVSDSGVSAAGIPQRVIESMARYGIDAVLFDEVHVEPTDASLERAIAFARAEGPWDAFVAVGGGSSIDTTKAINLMLTNPGQLMDYVNAPIGKGLAPSAQLKPLVAVPTTTGTGAEATTICILDVLDLHVKTGISHARLRPSIAVVDPTLTHSQPPTVTASAGMDILCHSLESFTARPYTGYDRKRPEERVPYCGSNPISDIWATQALKLMARSFRRAVIDGDDADARADMALAATFAGLGFGNAGVHIPHANAYPIAGRVKDFLPKDYTTTEPMVPHGMAVALTAPEAFRFTFHTDPERHLQAASLLAPETKASADPSSFLPDVLTTLMRDIGLPSGLAEVGYGKEDINGLVEGALIQKRVLAAAPCEVRAEDLSTIFESSLELW